MLKLTAATLIVNSFFHRSTDNLLWPNTASDCFILCYQNSILYQKKKKNENFIQKCFDKKNNKMPKK